MFVKSHYSLKYGILSPELLVQWAKEATYTHAVLIDNNTTTAALRFVREAQNQKINPVIGIDIRNEMEQCYVILAKNNRGFHEANTFLSSYLHTNCNFPQQPPHLGNCIVIYPYGKEPKQLADNEWIGIQKNDLTKFSFQKEKDTAKKMLAFEPMVFRNKRDFNTHRLLRAIAKNVLLSKLPLEEQENEDALCVTRHTWENYFISEKWLVHNTEKVLQSCSIHFAFGEDAKPQNIATYTGSKEEDLALLTQLANDGIAYRYSTKNEEVEKRIAMEIAIIAEKEYLSYFLITWDFTTYARSKGYFYVGRGSGANSIVAYLLRITDVDPLELDLYFERFINLYRKNPPDFDIDFSWKDRDDVVRYIFHRYPNACLLCTYNTFQYRATIRELGKVFGLPKEEIDTLSRKKFVFSQLDQISKLVLKYSEYIHGLPSHLSVHAGGIVLSEKPISWFSGTFLPPKGYPTTQFSMLEAEDIGLFKFDVLSQRGLGKIKDTLEIIANNQPENPPHSIHDIAYFKTDTKIKELLRSAKAIGCFYVESPAMRMLLIKLQVDTYLGLVAASSIIRPGVSQSGMMREYILRHRFPEKRKEAHPILHEIMPETYGVMVYQEDVIRVAHHFAGLSLAEADSLRRGMSGKFRSSSEFKKVEASFFNNCSEKGIDTEVSTAIWKQIESFAGYAFSKGHSASYAVESYQSLYLKAYYPLEYMTATINNFGGYYRTETYVHEARNCGANIHPPSLNYGAYDCTIKGVDLILGFNLVLGIEHKLILTLLKERQENGLFLNFQDLMKRVFIPLEQLVLIIRIGGLRDLQENRKALLWKAHFFHSRVKEKNRVPLLFTQESKEYTLPQLNESPLEIAFEQMELLGFPLCNPFELTATMLPEHTKAKEIPLFIGLKIVTFGYLVSLKQSQTNKGETMFFGTFIDQHGDIIDTVHFPETVRKYPFRGKGIYQLVGIVSEEFEYFTIEIGEMVKQAFIEDVRFTETDHPTTNTTQLAQNEKS